MEATSQRTHPVNVAAFVIGTTGFDRGSALARRVGRLALVPDRAILFCVGAGTVVVGAAAGIVAGETAAAITGVGLGGGVATVVVGTVGAQSVGDATWPELEVV
jgi:hypothetical protein